jgi:hypothetical protein
MTEQQTATAVAMQAAGFFDAISRALKPYGYEWPLSWTGIAGAGSQIVVFAGPGDFYTACLTHDCEVVWVMTCGGQEVDANTDECNALNRSARDFYHVFRRAEGASPHEVLTATKGD